jgi:hypothetical protein
LTGPQGFDVRYAWFEPSQPGATCGANPVPGGPIASAYIALFENDVSSAVCAHSALSDGGIGRNVFIGIATPEYASRNQPLTQALAAGAYVVGDEHQNDEDLCMLPVGATAMLMVVSGSYSIATAVSGTVTITSIDDHSVAGGFDVVLGDPYGNTDGGAPESLSGTFDAGACP